MDSFFYIFRKQLQNDHTIRGLYVQAWLKWTKWNKPISKST